MIAAIANRGTFGLATAMRRRSTFLNEICITDALALLIPIAGSAFAAATRASDRTATMSANGGNDRTHQFFRQQRANPPVIFVVLCLGRRHAKQHECDQQNAKRDHSGAAVSIA
jgi:hypothetical protein